MEPLDRDTLALLTIVVTLVVWGAVIRRGSRALRAVGLLVALVGSFYLYLTLSPTASTSAVVATGLFAGSALLFRALSTFEQ